MGRLGARMNDYDMRCRPLLVYHGSRMVIGFFVLLMLFVDAMSAHKIAVTKSSSKINYGDRLSQDEVYEASSISSMAIDG
jgi:hypothetical protein